MIAARETDYLTPPQLAKRLGVNRDTVAAWIKSGELAAENLARSANGRPRYRISAADLEAFLRRRSTIGAAPKPKPRRHRSGYPEYIPL